MIEVRSGSVEEDQIDTVFPVGMEFRGEILLEKSFMVKGRIEGRITSPGDLYIEESAFVEADVTADVVVIKGTVTGSVSAVHTIELLAEGSVEGDIEAPEITLETGCRHTGNLVMTGQRQDE